MFSMWTKSMLETDNYFIFFKNVLLYDIKSLPIRWYIYVQWKLASETNYMYIQIK